MKDNQTGSFEERFANEIEEENKKQQAKLDKELLKAIAKNDLKAINRLLSVNNRTEDDVLTRSESKKAKHDYEGADYDGPARSAIHRGNKGALDRERGQQIENELETERRLVISTFLKAANSCDLKKDLRTAVEMYCEGHSQGAIGERIRKDRTTVNRMISKVEKLARAFQK